MYLNINNIRRNSILHKISRKSQSQSGAMVPFAKQLFSLIILVSIFTSAHSCGPGRGIGGPRKNRKLLPLVFKQHVPNMSENTLGASGPHEGRIDRDHPKFKQLVPNYNKDIIFKDEEGSGADHFMSQRCREKLNNLAILVMNQWPAVRLRVTESWDEDQAHGPDSLHYEGRAVDITTSDRDRSKYGMLARLAVEAGFDWVYYKSRAHIHCSVKSDSTQPYHMGGCFSADSTVTTSTGEQRKMSELQLGEKVLSMASNGEPVYSEVIDFLDRSNEQTREFVEIHTDGGATLAVTPAHLVMVWSPTKSLMDYVFADRVEEGDFVLVAENSTLVPQRVIRLAAQTSRGLYAPLTTEGTIVVDSVAASCYALINSHALAHAGMLPLRLASSVLHWFGDGAEASTQNGIHWYARSLYALKDIVLPSNWIYH